MRENLITDRSRDFYGDQKSRDLHEKFQDLSKKNSILEFLCHAEHLFSIKTHFFRLIVDYRLKGTVAPV